MLASKIDLAIDTPALVLAIERKQALMAKMLGEYSECTNLRRLVIHFGCDISMTLIRPEQIEQFVLTKPEHSWQAFDDMIAISEEFYKSLGIPYQVVTIVSGALNNAAAKKYDLEAWFPYQSEYRPLVSCSNCTDYQARPLEIRYGSKQLTEIRKKYVHALNSTLCATERALCCLLENYQTEEGVRVPEVLRKWMPGEIDFIPYTKDLPKDSTSNKAKGKASGPNPKVPPPVDGTAEDMKKLEV